MKSQPSRVFDAEANDPQLDPSLPVDHSLRVFFIFKPWSEAMSCLSYLSLEEDLKKGSDFVYGLLRENVEISLKLFKGFILFLIFKLDTIIFFREVTHYFLPLPDL